MYKKILVPLDESALAECVLPHVKAIAKGCGTGEVVLLEVVEPPPTWAAEGINFDAVQNANARAAEAYLANQQEKQGHGPVEDQVYHPQPDVYLQGAKGLIVQPFALEGELLHSDQAGQRGT